MNQTNSIYINDIYLKYGLPFKGRYLYLFGGAGSGKSYFAVQKWVIRLMQEEGHRILVTRKVARTIKNSVWNLFLRCIDQFGISHLVKKNKVEKTITFPNGNQILFAGVDDPEKVKSIDGITGQLHEEVTEQEKGDFLQLDMRLRGETKNYKQVTSCFNPVSKEHWLVELVEPNLDGKKLPSNIIDLKVYEGGKVWDFIKLVIADNGEKEYVVTRVINTTYKDNFMIDNEYRTILKTISSLSENHEQVYEFGRWGDDTEGENYLPNFVENEHVMTVYLNKDLVLHYTLDFNTSPYMSGLVIQIENSKPGETYKGFTQFQRIKVLREYPLEYPRNSGYDLGDTFARDYKRFIPGIFYLYGDASGKNSTGIKSGQSLFADVEHGLGDLKGRTKKRIPNANPRYHHMSKNKLGRRWFFDRMVRGDYPIKLEIDPSCEKFIADLKKCKADKDGKLDKKKEKGIEMKGHLLQAFEYFFCHIKTFGYLNKI